MLAFRMASCIMTVAADDVAFCADATGSAFGVYQKATDRVDLIRTAQDANCIKRRFASGLFPYGRWVIRNLVRMPWQSSPRRNLYLF